MESAKLLIDRIVDETGFSKAAIARKMGITPPYLSRLYAGAIQFTPGMYARLTKSFPMIWPEMAEGVPYYATDFVGGYDESFYKYTAEPSMRVTHPLNGMADLWIKNKGNAMSPLIESDDVIALRDVPKDSVMYGYIYAVVMKDRRYIRRIRRSEREGCWRLAPENVKDFDEIDVNVDDVLRVFSVDAVSREINL